MHPDAAIAKAIYILKSELIKSMSKYMDYEM